MRELWPTLEIIEARLSGEVIGEPANSPRLQDVSAFEADLSLQEPPPVLQAQFEKHEAAKKQSFLDVPQSGQVLLIDYTQRKTNGVGTRRPCPQGVLLDAPSESREKWSGWLVVPDTDYAAYWDLVLDHRDEPFDPYAGMVQVWNPVSIEVASGCKVLAQLSPQRLAAVRLLEHEFLAREGMVEETARPGFVAPRTLSNGELVLTGTQLGDARDPRRAYQSLYWEAANTLRVAMASNHVLAFPVRKKQPAQLEDMPEAMAAVVEVDAKSRDANPTWLKPAFIVAVIIVILQMIVIGILLRGNYEAENPPVGPQNSEEVAPH